MIILKSGFYISVSPENINITYFESGANKTVFASSLQMLLHQFPPPKKEFQRNFDFNKI